MISSVILSPICIVHSVKKDGAITIAAQKCTVPEELSTGDQGFNTYKL